MERPRWTSVPTPLGTFVLVGSQRGLAAASFEDDVDAYLDGIEGKLGAGVRPDDRAFAATRREVEGYFAGQLRRFGSPIDPVLIGGAFARRVIVAARSVPYATMATYGDVAARAGSPRAWRAAGTALRNCPFELLVPCHRVVPAGSGFGSYGGHPERREFLLRLEGAI
jgi:methylated-DNA-[protein]-cysteine S-methyltransferase